jgi:hypothetical protein
MSYLWILSAALWTALASIGEGPAVMVFGSLAGFCLVATLLAVAPQAWRALARRRPPIAALPAE